ncbi:MAG: ATP-binding protein [Kiritimatiellia bacterium]
MTKKIFYSILLAAVSVLFASLVLILGYLYGHYRGVQSNQLRDELRLASYGVEAGGLGYLQMATAKRPSVSYGEQVREIDYLQEVAASSRFPISGDYRLTWIGTDGTVLFDSRVPLEKLENHGNRAEVRQALAKGESSEIRYSDTLTEQTLYFARRLKDGTVLRISISQLTVLALVLGMIHPILLIAFLAVVLSAVLAHRMAKSIVSPLNHLDLSKPLENDTYEELSPLLARIHQQHRQIEAQIRELARKTEEFEQITENLNEGLVLLDKKGVIVSINPAARNLFHAEEGCVGLSFLMIERDHEVNQAIANALETGHSEICIARDRKEYQLEVSRICTEGGVAGTVVLAFDITGKAAAERSRREFTANVSHELKTPLQSIMGSAELLQNGLVRQEDVPQFMGTIRTEAGRLVSLVDDIIHLSQLDEGIALQKEPVNLLDLAHAVAHSLEECAAKRNVSLTVSGEAASINGVRSFLYELLYNLMENAIKYNVENGTADITVREDGSSVKVAVQDTGIGIPKEYQASVFERFFRVDKSRSKSTGGTGLGLSIVKHIAQYHHAAIDLQSEEKRGTRVEIIFPKGEK